MENKLDALQLRLQQLEEDTANLLGSRSIRVGNVIHCVTTEVLKRDVMDFRDVLSLEALETRLNELQEENTELMKSRSIDMENIEYIATTRELNHDVANEVNNEEKAKYVLEVSNVPTLKDEISKSLDFCSNFDLGNVDYSATTEGLKQYLLECGAVKEPKRNQVRVQRSLMEHNNLKSIYVKNICFDATVEELKQYFGVCGAIIWVTLLCNKFTGYFIGCALVEFANLDSVSAALALDLSVFRGRQLSITAKCKTNQFS
uniref:RRM domain-containing protein n=1 Tax=Strigamia maritima TaxID=126957 RepID=T1INZ3_STRMM